MMRIRLWIPLIIVWLLLPAACSAQTLTVREFLKQQDQWPKWATEARPLNINGRYEGRVARQFRLAQLPILMTPSRITSLPASIEAGQRMTISGVLKKSGSRYQMDVTRIAVGRTDHERLSSRVEQIGEASPEKWYAVLEEYQQIADFYKDDFLQKLTQRFRDEAFALQRAQARDDAEALTQLVEFGKTLNAEATVLNSIQFESVIALINAKRFDRTKTLKHIQKTLPGWDKPATLSSDLARDKFLKEPNQAYAAADQLTKLSMHRWLYRSVKLPELVAPLKPDGSNALDVAEALAKQLPEEIQEIARLRSLYVDYRITRVPHLTRPGLRDLSQLLTNSGRAAEVSVVVDRWLEAQDKRRNNGRLDGLMDTSNEYAFAFEQWKREVHRDAAVQLLKRGWKQAMASAPKQAEVFENRLEELGWVRLDERWMTRGEMSRLPADDVALAIREGRLVAGMTAAQAIVAQGKPSRTIRVVSAKHVQEIWIYELLSPPITVHLQRARREKPEDAVTILVR